MRNCICKIYLKNSEIGLGFFCKITFNNNILPFLITSSHILEDIDKNKIIKLFINNDVKKIKIDNSRKIYISHDKNIDIAIIEIKPNIDKIYNYLELDINELYKNEENLDLKYTTKLIYIIYYQNEEICVSYNFINEIINSKKFKYYNKIEEGSFGCPILSLKSFKVIGIQYGNSQNIRLNYGIFIKNVINEFNRYKNEINIIYEIDEENVENIFGDEFVKKNKHNIELIINGIEYNLISKFKLKKGENNIKIITINKITNFEYMFYECKSLKNIKGLEYLYTKDINNFNYMFYGCSSLQNINGLENWNVSNGNNFSYMFNGCSSLSDIKELENWNVLKGNNFSFMFSGCLSLSNVRGLENWNVSNGNYFSYMFNGCSSLSELKALENWNVIKGYDFKSMFSGCSSLSDIKGLENWNVSNGNDFSLMFN